VAALAPDGTLLREGTLHMRWGLWTLAVIAFSIAPGRAQDNKTAYCNYTDGNQVSMQYNSVVKEQPKNGRIWAPGITLFAQSPLKVGNSRVAIGAYTIYLMPDKRSWTLIVSKNVTAGAAYDSAQDVARAPMEIGEIPEATKNLELSFAHMSAKECSLRVYYAKTGAFTDFLEAD
jgi:hypothetical protein